MQLLAEAGQTFRGKTLTPEMIADVVSTFDEVGRAPLTFGHPTGQDEPKAGDVLRVASNADNSKLYSDIKALDKVTEAVDEGFFDDRSVGIARSEDGEHYLHHVALLGGTPPQIKGMEPLSSLPIDFSEEGEVMYFGDEEEHAEPMLTRLAERLRSYFADADPRNSKSDDMPDSEETTDFSDLPREELEARLKEQESGEGSEDSGESGSDEAYEFADSDLYQDMKSEIERQRSERRKSEIEAVREAASGKVPKPTVDAFADLAAALPDTVETATFADDDTEEEVSPRQKLASTLAELPDLVSTGPMHLSDNGEEKSEGPDRKEVFSSM